MKKQKAERSDLEILADVKKCILRICKVRDNLLYADSKVEQWVSDDLFELNFSKIGEAFKSLSPRLKKAFQDIDWASYQKSRDYIVHEYFNLQHDAFLEKSIDEIPQLETRIDQVLESLH